MRFSRTGLALKYADRNPQLSGAVLLLLSTLVISPIFLPIGLRELRLWAVGERTRATVTAKFIAAATISPVTTAALFAHGGGANRRSYQLRYEFTVGGRVFGGSVGVFQSEWQTVQVGQALNVVYLPTDPHVNGRAKSFGDALPPPPFWFGPAAWLIAPVLAVRGIRGICRKVRLIAEGSPALGMIDEVEVTRGRKGSVHVASVRYMYPVETGHTRQIYHGELRGRFLYAPGEVSAGDRVLVVYDPDDPTRSEIDRFDA
jgi:hypothetical protein